MDGYTLFWIPKEWNQTIFFKYKHSDQEFSTLSIARPRRSSTTASLIEIKGYSFSSLYNGALPITKAKYDDLNKLCEKGLVPARFHTFYARLPTTVGQLDRLPEPDEQDGDSESDNEQ